MVWIVEWAYMIAAIVINVRAVIKEKGSYKKSEYRGYLVFALPMAIAAICQMVFYGVTTAQIGYMMALLLIHLNRQYYQIHKDDLTGLNNKNALLHYRDSLVNRTEALELTILLVDADHFKEINDIHGHLKGDQALKDIAEVLRKSVENYSRKRLMLFRYGGDEFVIIGQNLLEEHILQLQETMQKIVEETNGKNQELGEPYHLAISIGAASRSCHSVYDFDELMKAADEEMYQIKRRRKANRK